MGSHSAGVTFEEWRANVAGEWKAHWRVGVAAFLGSAVSTSMHTSVSSLFIEPWQREFGWSRGDISLASSAAIVTALFAPFLGQIIDRVGVRYIALAGIVLSAMCYALFSTMTGSLPVYYALNTALVFVGMGVSGITFTNAVSAVFVKARGFSLAIVRTGLSTSTIIAPAILFFVISHLGWRAGYLTLALILLCIALPTTWAWIRLPPQRATKNRASRDTAGGIWKELLSQRRMWFLAIGTAFNYAPVLMLLSQLHPLLSSKGLQPHVAAALVGGVGASALIGAALAGLIIDRVWAPAISALFSTASALGCALLLFGPADGLWLVYVAVGLIGLAYGAENDLMSFFIARYFGMKSFSSIYGILLLALSVGTSLAIWMAGASFDLTGGYAVMLSVAAGAFIVAALAHLALGPYPLLTSEEHS